MNPNDLKFGREISKIWRRTIPLKIELIKELRIHIVLKIWESLI
jgi:hypothetical protein